MTKPTTRLRSLASRLDTLLGVRGRIALLVLILAIPLMVHRVWTLEQSRAGQIRLAIEDIAELAQRGAEAQKNVVTTVEMSLKAMAELYVAFARQGDGCAAIAGSARIKPDILGNISISGKSGRVLCSTLPGLVGLDITDRPYFHQAMMTGQFALSDYLVLRTRNGANLVAALPTMVVDERIEAVIVTSIELNWINQVLAEAKARPGTKAFLLDRTGTVIAGSAGIESWSGAKPPDGFPLIKVLSADSGVIAPATFAGRPQLMSFVRVPQTSAYFVVAVNQAAVLAEIDRAIRNAYVQFTLLTLAGLLGAWFASERLIMRPLRVMTSTAMKFGRGDLSARARTEGLPGEFKPLAKAFNAMAAQLSDREREMVAANTRLTVLASVDAVSGLANRRGFDSRLDFEWARAQSARSPLGALMIDVDHFKLFNDRYGHPEGDACLRRIGDLLAGVAAETSGFAARYGGEEFLLLLPATDAERVTEVGERICAMVQKLRIPHLATDNGVVTVSIGSATLTPEPGQSSARLIGAADAGLYSAKRRGRNQVVVHGPLEPLSDFSELAVLDV